MPSEPLLGVKWGVGANKGRGGLEMYILTIAVVFCVLYAAYRGLDKLIDWMITKIFD